MAVFQAETQLEPGNDALADTASSEPLGSSSPSRGNANVSRVDFDMAHLNREGRPAVFLGRHFQDQIILLSVRWYLRYASHCGIWKSSWGNGALRVDHSTIGR